MSIAQARTIKHTFIEAQLRGQHLLNDPATLNALRQRIGINWDYPEAVYPYDLVQQVTRFLLGKQLTGGRPLEQALYQLGYDTAAGFRETILGRVGFVASPMMKPFRVAERVVYAYNDQTNFGDRTCVQLAPTHVQVEMRDDPTNPDWLRGLFDFALISHKVTVKCAQTAFEHTTTDITW